MQTGSVKDLRLEDAPWHDEKDIELLDRMSQGAVRTAIKNMTDYAGVLCNGSQVKFLLRPVDGEDNIKRDKIISVVYDSESVVLSVDIIDAVKKTVKEAIEENHKDAIAEAKERISVLIRQLQKELSKLQ